MAKLSKGQQNDKLYGDTMSVIYLTINVALHARTKHIQLRYHFIRTLLEGKHISLEKMHTVENSVNMFTKVVTQEKLKLYLVLVGV